MSDTLNDHSTPTVLFIMGSGHSGSTVIDLLLGRHRDVISVGEINRLHECFEFDRKCTCGKRVGSCPLWSEVARLGKSKIPGFPEQEWEPSLTSLNQYKSITPSVANRLWQVSTILAGVARVRFIVDSSKSPKRTALAVKAMPENSRILWLTRDGRGVVHSLKKDEVLPVEDLAQRWLRTNQICGQIVDSLGREQAMHLRYEEFCVAPEDAISRILTFLHPDLKDAQTRSTRMAHNIAGNRCRYTFRKTVRQDLSWRERLSQDDVAQFERIGGALNRQLLGKLFVD